MSVVYRRLLRLYPARFRQQWQEEMAQLGEQLLARARAEAGLAGVLRLWPRLLADLACGALAERRHQARYRSTRSRLTLERRTTRMLDDLRSDLRGALRLLRRSPAHALAIVLTLGLGIGVTTAVYSVVRVVLLEPLPYADPERLVLLSESNPSRQWTQAQVAPANYFDWVERSRSFSAIAGFNDSLTQSIATGGTSPERVRALSVVGDLFGVLGVPPAQGRSFRAAETWEGAPRVVVLSHAYWQRQLGGAADAVGRAVTLNGRPYEVIGVMPEGFTFFSEDVDLWTPFVFDPADRPAVWFRRAHIFRAVARLAPGITQAQADAEMKRLAGQLEREYPETNTEMGAGASPLADYLVGSARRPLTLLFAGAGLVLLIAIANVAHLQLARLSAQLRDNAVRGCLGASRWRLVRRSLVESLTLSALGAAMGAVLAWRLVPVLVSLGREFLPRPSEVRVDLAALAFAAVLGVLTALLSGAAAAQRGARPDLERALREGGRAEARGRARLRQRLVAAEVALAVMVVAAAVLLVRTLVALGNVPPGFEPRGVTTATLALPALSYPDAPAFATFSRRLLAGVRALPGVESAGLVRSLPLTASHWSSDMAVEGRGPDDFGVDVIHREASDGYFETLRVPLLAGRLFRDSDDDEAPAVVVINKTLADRYFGGGDPIGQRLCFDRHPDAKSYWRTVVGVVGDERQDGLGRPVQPEIFAPLLQDRNGRFALVVRSSLPPQRLVPELREVLRRIDPQLPLFDVRTLDEVAAASVARERFLLALFGTFAALSLVLAALGVYGVTSEATAQRRREIAVRLAVGARTEQLVRRTVGREMTAVAVGVLAGLAGAFGLGRAMAGLLFGVGGQDPLTLAGAPAVMLTVALVAAWLPARRTARVAPAEVLRE